MFIAHFNDAVFLAKLIDFVIFIALIVWLYNKAGKGVLVSYQETQNKLVGEAMAYRDRSEAAVATARSNVDQAAIDARRMVEVGDAQAARLVEAEIVAAREHADRIIAHASGELERERYRVRRQLFEETVEDAHAQAQELARKDIDPAKQQSLVERLIHRLEHGRA